MHNIYKVQGSNLGQKKKKSIFQVQDLEKFDYALEDESIPHREYLPTI